jgi:TonB family protein
MARLNRILLLLCVMVLAALGVMAQAPGGDQTDQTTPRVNHDDPIWWKRYTVKDEGFSVKLPTLPAMTSSKVFNAGLQQQLWHRQLKTSVGGVVYTVDVFENPQSSQSLPEFIAELNADAALDLTTERNLNVNGFAGKEYSVRNKTYPAMVQFFATERRLYRFTAGGPAENAGVKQFFSSIVLGEKTEGIKVVEGPGIPLELDTGERVFLGSEVDTKVRLLNKPEPVPPGAARTNDVRGVVVLRAVFSGNGTVTNIRIISGLPYGMTDSAIDAARRIKFVPAMKDGKPVSMWLQLEYNFNF